MSQIYGAVNEQIHNHLLTWQVFPGDLEGNRHSVELWDRVVNRVLVFWIRYMCLECYQ